MKWKIMVSAPYLIPEIDRFMYWFDEHDMEIVIPNVEERLEADELKEIIGPFDGVVCGDDRFSEEVYQCANELKVISKWGTGIDSINKDIAEKYGIKVYNTTDAFSHPVSDTAMAFILAFSRNIVSSDNRMKLGKWEKIQGRCLREQTLGIIGCGNIGTRLARKAEAFGMRILVYDIKKIPEYLEEQYNLEQVELDMLLHDSDYVSLHCDLNDTSYHIMNKNTFSKMKNTAYLINTARGAIIDEKELVGALKQKRIAGCGLDVYEVEPLPKSSPLRNMDNVLLSSHNSNSSPMYWEKVHRNTLENLYNGLIEYERKGRI